MIFKSKLKLVNVNLKILYPYFITQVQIRSDKNDNCT